MAAGVATASTIAPVKAALPAMAPIRRPVRVFVRKQKLLFISIPPFDIERLTTLMV